MVQCGGVQWKLLALSLLARGIAGLFGGAVGGALRRRPASTGTASGLFGGRARSHALEAQQCETRR